MLTSYRIALVAAALVLGLSGTARAGDGSFRDARGDVERVRAGSDLPGTVDPHRADGDLVRYDVTYSHRRISAVLHFRALDHTRRIFAAGLRLQWQDDVQFQYADAYVDVRHGHWAGRAQLSFDGSPCRVAHHVDYRRDQVSISFPASCIDSPRWIKPLATMFTQTDGHAQFFGYDEQPEQRTNVETFGPRVDRG